MNTFITLALRSIPFIIFGLALAVILLGPATYGVGALLILVIHPLADHLIGVREINDTQASLQWMRWQIAIYPYLQIVFLIIAAFAFAQSPDLLARVLLLLSVGLVTGGLGITLAHECVHSPKLYYRSLGVFLLAQVNYSHFRIEHVFGHHRMVSTPQDPASARFNEGLYAFLYRSITGSFLSALKIENARARRYELKFWQHRFVHYGLFSLGLTVFFWFLTGPAGIVFFWAQSIIAFVVLEIVNYIEHYGLTRKQDSAGKWEAVEFDHSWDSAHLLTNMTLYNLGRHAHHHHKAAVPAEDLINPPGSRRLPMGYSTALLLALIPPLWRKIMNPLTDALKES
jgi:alkane 1-monooxygenase